MKITIEIPEEFRKDCNDKFYDFFSRVIAGINSNNNPICGNYEKETAQMLIEAFRCGIVDD